MSASPALYDLTACSDKELNQLERMPAFRSMVLDFRANRESLVAEKIALAKTATYTVASLGGRSFSYAEILMLATIGVKKWYEMPESNPVQEISDEIAQILAGIQSREANALKLAISQAI